MPWGEAVTLKPQSCIVLYRGWNSQSHRTLQKDSKVVGIYTSSSRGSLYMQYKHIYMQGCRERRWETKCVSKTLLLFGITLLIWAWGNGARRTNEHHDVSNGSVSHPATRRVQQLIETKKVQQTPSQPRRGNHVLCSLKCLRIFLVHERN